jgi:hypothetical protein
MTRREELLNIIGKEHISQGIGLVDELLFLEQRLVELRKLPHLKVDEDNPQRQKATAAARQYKDTLNQYNNTLRLLLKISGDIGENEEESPLRKWLKGRTDDSDIERTS